MQLKKYKQFTYQARLKVNSDTDKILGNMSEYLSFIERKLFSDLMKGKNIRDLKKKYIKEYEITARQFNSCRCELEGKINSYKEKKELRKKLLKDKINNIEKVIKKYRNPNKIHQKKRKLYNLRKKLENLEKESKPRICFGSKKLFKKQFHLQKNGFSDFNEWKKEWKEKRNNSFFLIGSKDESCGNQSCQITKNNNDTFNLKIRLSNKFAKSFKTVSIENISFSYGKSTIIKAIENNLKRKDLKSKKRALYNEEGNAINYRFKRDKKSWIVFITLHIEEPDWISKKDYGVIGIDINANHLALVETDRYLNPIKTKKINLCLYGKNKNQSLALIGEASKEICQIALIAKKPIIIEKLDFQKKKSTLQETNNRYLRMLSSFSYRSIIKMINSKAWRSKIEVFDVNPAFTTLIGKIKFAVRYGLSNHLSAALAIARRYMKVSEKPPHQKKVFFFDAKGSMRAFLLPERNRKKHLWSFLKEISEKIKTMDVPYFGATKSRSLSTLRATYEIEIPENYERNSHTLKFVDKAARSTSLKKSLL